MLQVPNRNIAAILELAAFFETLRPDQYDQSTFNNDGCRCICGWINFRRGNVESDTEAASQTLGIDRLLGTKLFHGKAGTRKMSGRFGWVREVPPTPQEAASCLRHLAVTGELPETW